MNDDPNSIVPTAAPGTSTNQAASTAFVLAAIATAPIKVNPYTVATLPSAAANAGLLAFVSDALAPTYLATVVGGGTYPAPVFSTGLAWVCV